ncbi:hypothetical protein AH07_39 [Pantoea phage AH07]|nr:hypothetical protein AH07_39 [Pantoea phage AH07]
MPPGALVRLTNTRAETLRLCAIFVSLPRALAAFTTTGRALLNSSYQVKRFSGPPDSCPCSSSCNALTVMKKGRSNKPS